MTGHIPQKETPTQALLHLEHSGSPKGAQGHLGWALLDSPPAPNNHHLGPYYAYLHILVENTNTIAGGK